MMAILLFGRLNWPLSSMLLDEVEETDAVEDFRRVDLECAPQPVGIALHGLVVDRHRVGMHGDDARIRHHVEQGGTGLQVVAEDEGVHLVAVDEALGRLDDHVVALRFRVDEVELDRPSENAAERVDLFRRQLQPAPELDAVCGDDAGERRRAADRDRIAGGLRHTGVEARQHGGRTEAGAGALEEVAPAGAAVVVIVVAA